MTKHYDTDEDMDETGEQNAREQGRASKARRATQESSTVASFADFQALRAIPSTQAMETIMTKGKQQFEKLSSEAATVGKDHVDAWMKSSSIFMKGYEDIIKTYMSMAQKNAEKSGEAVKTLLACKTVNEYAEVQNRLTQEGFDELMAGATKLSELSVKLVSDGFAPINDQLGRTIKKASDSIAA